MLKFPFEPFEVMLTLPLTEPLAVGAKRTVNDVLCPTFNVNGNVSPLKLKPEPLAAAAEIVRLEPPVFVRVSVAFAPVPTWTFPKATLVGLGVNVPALLRFRTRQRQRSTQIRSR